MASSSNPPSPTRRTDLKSATTSLDSTLINNTTNTLSKPYIHTESQSQRQLQSMDVESVAESSDRHKCCGVVEEARATARDKRERRLDARGSRGQPWIVAKLMVGITFGIMGYAGYVYVGLLVVPMLRQRKGAGGTRSTGIALLVVFSILYLWMIWAYIKVIFTPPGHARDYIPKSPQPFLPPTAAPPLPISGHESLRTSGTINGNTEVEMGYARHTEDRIPASQPFQLTSTALNGTAALPKKERGHIGGPAYEDMTKMMSIPAGMERSVSTMTVKSKASVRSKGSGTKSYSLRFDAGEMVNAAVVIDEGEGLGDGVDQENREPETEAGVLDAYPLPLHTAAHESRDLGEASHSGSKPAPPSLFWKGKQKHSDREGDIEAVGSRSKRRWGKEPRPRTYIARRPPMTPVLSPVHRYCMRDEIVKPYRTHHCRNCGTCVLKYDHHCPWIGQCVGARNHKFFINFCQAAFVFTTYVFSTLLAYTVKGFSRVDLDVNPQQIVIIAIAALFALFTSTLVASHTHMICQGQTTVESMQIRTMKEREKEQLGNAFGMCAFGTKWRTLKEWDQEWGDLDREGHIWWIGGNRREWEDVMGKNRLGWILPIGRSLNDGLEYSVNPRFDSEGKWRKRVEWPEGVR